MRLAAVKIGGKLFISGVCRLENRYPFNHGKNGFFEFLRRFDKLDAHTGVSTCIRIVDPDDLGVD